MTFRADRLEQAQLKAADPKSPGSINGRRYMAERNFLVPAVSFFIIASATVTAIPVLFFESGNQAHLAFYSDDFFYYLKTAQNFSRLGWPTFDGINATNGFHPFWFLVLTGLTRLFSASNGTLFYALQLIIFALSLGSTFLLWQILKSLDFHGPTAFMGLAPTHIGTLYLMQTGMEVILVIPLCYLAILAAQNARSRETVRSFALFGFVSAMTLLARLDSFWLIALLIGTVLISQVRARAEYTARRLLRTWGAFCVSGFPFPAYLIVNLLIFGDMMPQSGKAKHLGNGLFFLKPLETLLDQPLTLVNLLFHGAIVLHLFVSAHYALSRYRPVPFSGTVISLLAFPFLFYGYIVTFISWYMWSWYYYPLVLSLGISVCYAVDLIGRLFPLPARATLLTMGAGLAAVYLIAQPAITFLRADPSRNEILRSGLEVAKFSNQHPKLYAMGNGAGVAGYVMNAPLIQLEGLVSGAKILGYIEQKAPLIDVLNEFHVDYYVVLEPVKSKPPDGCYHLEEPNHVQAGDSASKMSGILCKPPVFRYTDGTIQTLIFDMHHN